MSRFAQCFNTTFFRAGIGRLWSSRPTESSFWHRLWMTRYAFGTITLENAWRHTQDTRMMPTVSLAVFLWQEANGLWVAARTTVYISGTCRPARSFRSWKDTPVRLASFLSVCAIRSPRCRSWRLFLFVFYNQMSYYVWPATPHRTSLLQEPLTRTRRWSFGSTPPAHEIISACTTGIE